MIRVGIRRMVCPVRVVAFGMLVMRMSLMGIHGHGGLCLSVRNRKIQRILMVGLRELSIRLAGSCAFLVAEITTLHRALDVVMVAVLRKTDFTFKTKHLCSVFTERTIHRTGAFDDF